MNSLLQLGIIFAFTYGGELISSALSLPIPGSIIGMFLALIALLTGVLKERHIDKAGDFILTNMTLFFVAPGVGLLAHTDLLGSIWVQLFLVNFISFFLCYLATSWSVVGVNYLRRRVLRG
ncbi:MAG: CidA/LrgA family protein [Sphaerochaeta sp.]